MIHVRSNGIKKDIGFREGITAQDALDEAEIRKGWRRRRILVGDKVVKGSYFLKDEDTVTIAPKIKNG